MIKNTNSKMTTSNYQQLNLKKQEQNELSKQLEQVQSHRNRDDMESISKEGKGEEWGQNYWE